MLKDVFHLCIVLAGWLVFPFVSLKAQRSGVQAELPTRWTKQALSAAVPLDEYPRQQLERSEWLCLNGTWNYHGGHSVASAENPSAVIEFASASEKIRVPFCPESLLSGIKRSQEVNMLYQREFTLPASWNGRRTILHFEAVDHKATVFVNGRKAASHAGGYDAFWLDITDFLTKGQTAWSWPLMTPMTGARLRERTVPGAITP